ncbi:Homoserine O-acetyltransferase [bioreactor metagenome]|uniref:Homoserine O-acetyltransferase n=1 Tax=bioreactor metagenome TaxID=1076179 RepID=A0A644U903_9ZZZZ|nr:alpha/beta fold hydrolase [Methanobrevibacter sp.]MEA4957599.1 alpha/beta fold hydrolase [Methanobrevibacter sp.]
MIFISFENNNYEINEDEFYPEYFELKSFDFSSGERLENLMVEYYTIGTPIKDDEGHITNAVIFLHGWGGDCGSVRRIKDIIGLKKPLDTKKFFIISITTLGSPNSASPSTTNLGNKFPEYSIEDMVKFHIDFLESKFKIEHVKGIIGNSMGGFEALTWGAKYPKYMDFLISLVSTYKVAGHNYALFKFMNHIIENDKDFNGGNYLNPPKNALALANESMYTFGLSTDYYYNLKNSEIDIYMEEMREEAINEWDANDTVYRNNASTSYNIEDIISNIEAKTLIVAINQDQYFPPKLDGIPMSKKINNSEIIVYDSVMGHIGTHEIIKIEKELENFLKIFK